MQTDAIFFAIHAAADRYGIRDRESFLHGIAGYIPAITMEDKETQNAFIDVFSECFQRIERGALVAVTAL